MGKKLWIVLGGLVGLPLLVLLAFFLEAHLEIRSLEAPLPTEAERAAFAAGARGPVSIEWVESGRQARADGGVSTTGSFFLRWPDGRGFLIDAGMTADEMLAFGAALETAMGAGPIRVFGSVAAQIGRASRRIEGVGFTHLHHDHTDGAEDLCAARDGAPLSLFQVGDQAERGNYTTDPGRARVEAAACLERVRLGAAGGAAEGEASEVPRLHPVPGLPGLAAFAAGGHTPGSTVFVARLPDRIVYFAGDITNEHARLLANEGKGFVYSYLMIPENTGRLEALRRWLAARHAEPDTFVVVSHDLSGMPEAGIALPDRGEAPGLDAALP